MSLDKKVISVIVFMLLIIFTGVGGYYLIESNNFVKVNMTSGNGEQTRDFKMYEFGIKDNNICIKMEDIVNEVIELYSDKLDFEYIDVTSNISMTNVYNIDSIPTFIIVDKDGVVKYRKSGFMNKDEFIKFIEKINEK